MDYMILDSAGNALASFDDELAARATMHALVAVEPDAAEHLVLLAYDEHGMPVGEARTYFDVPPAVEIEPSPYLMMPLTKTLIRSVLRRNTRYHVNELPTWKAGRSDLVA